MDTVEGVNRVIHFAELSVSGMRSANASILEIDGELEDADLRETVNQNEILITSYANGIAQLQEIVLELR